MKNLFLTFVVLLFAGTLHCLAAGNGYSAEWQKGDSFYQQKQFDSAAYYFEEIAALKPQNEAVYYNLGNSYYKLNKIPLAVLNYERALKINPEYKEAKDNLLLAQSRISNHIPYLEDIFFIAWWKNVTRATIATRWAIITLVLFILIIISFALRRFQKSTGIHIPSQLPGILSFVFVITLILSIASARNNEQNTGAVVMQNDAPLMNNDLKGKPLTLIPEGTTVKIISEKGGWTEVSLPDGRNGWLQQNLLEKI